MTRAVPIHPLGNSNSNSNNLNLQLPQPLSNTIHAFIKLDSPSSSHQVPEAENTKTIAAALKRAEKIMLVKGKFCCFIK